MCSLVIILVNALFLLATSYTVIENVWNDDYDVNITSGGWSTPDPSVITSGASIDTKYHGPYNDNLIQGTHIVPISRQFMCQNIHTSSVDIWYKIVQCGTEGSNVPSEIDYLNLYIDDQLIESTEGYYQGTTYSDQNLIDLYQPECDENNDERGNDVWIQSSHGPLSLTQIIADTLFTLRFEIQTTKNNDIYLIHDIQITCNILTTTSPMTTSTLSSTALVRSSTVSVRSSTVSVLSSTDLSITTTATTSATTGSKLYRESSASETDDTTESANSAHGSTDNEANPESIDNIPHILIITMIILAICIVCVCLVILIVLFRTHAMKVSSQNMQHVKQSVDPIIATSKQNAVDIEYPLPTIMVAATLGISTMNNYEQNVTDGKGMIDYLKRDLKSVGENSIEMAPFASVAIDFVNAAECDDEVIGDDEQTMK